MVIVFFGNERLATGVTSTGITLDILIKNGHKVAKIYTKHQEDFARKDVPISVSSDFEDIANELRQLKPDIGILVAYGVIVPEEIIDIFPQGIINIHPSLLPKGRGPSPIEQVILDGSKQTGVSIMKLVKEMDKGPVLAQSTIALGGKETKQQLADTMLSLGDELLIKCLEEIESSGTINLIAQSEPEASYTHKIKKSDGVIDWGKPAENIEREVRAYAGWPQTRTKLNDIECIITAADVTDYEGKPGDYQIINGSLVVFSEDKALSVKRIKPAGRKDMSIEEFLRGYRTRL